MFVYVCVYLPVFDIPSLSGLYVTHFRRDLLGTGKQNLARKFAKELSTEQSLLPAILFLLTQLFYEVRTVSC